MDSSAGQTSSVHWSFSLRDALGAITAVAVLLTPFRLFGGAYLVSIAFSVALVACCIVAYGSGQRILPVGAAAAGAIVGFPLAIGLLVYFCHAVLNVLVCIPLVLLNVRPRVFAFVVTAAMAAVYGYAMWQGVAGVRELQALQARYPFESLEGRLAFERYVKPSDAEADTSIQLTVAMSTRLDEQDDAHEPRYYSYSQSLRELHEESARQFARAAGFGVLRMPSVEQRLIRTTERGGLTLPAPVLLGGAVDLDAPFIVLHSSALYDFISPDRIGYVRSRTAVAGFDSHGFSELDKQLARSYGATKPNWQMMRLELVSLLRHDEPRVYVTEALPQMDQLAEVPHRALNDFERKSLQRLRAQDDIVVERRSGRIQMLGALRAGRTCLECHDGERGKLLGAFSYAIAPIVATEPVPTEAASSFATPPADGPTE